MLIAGRTVGFWLLFLFGVSWYRPENVRARVAYETGFGTSSPRCNRLDLALQHDFRGLAQTLFGIIGICCGVYYFVEPEHLYDIQYVLGVVMCLYAGAAITLTRQAIGETYDFRARLRQERQQRRPIQTCRACRLSYPIEDLITFDVTKQEAIRSTSVASSHTTKEIRYTSAQFATYTAL
ncbi:hypothetical protein F4678DRAFT_483512 [Xylaria arbuscula]|nr:hypothetical protein F4678DRAFT_483512 [Xylaria arbuscula]